MKQIIDWIDVNNELPTNTFECIVKMWDRLNGTWETGIGIYDVPNEEWEVQAGDEFLKGTATYYPVYFWVQVPEFLEENPPNK